MKEAPVSTMRLTMALLFAAVLVSSGPAVAQAPSQADANRAVVRRAFAALDKGDVTELNAVFDPKGPIHSTHGTTTLQGGPFTELKDSCPMCAALSHRKITVDMTVSEGDLIVVRSTWSGDYTGTIRGMSIAGKPVRIVYTNIYRIAGGRIVENWYQTNGIDLADQLGLKLVAQPGSK